MEKEHPVCTFTMTLDTLLALDQALDRLQQALVSSHAVQMRTIDLLEKWEHESMRKPLHSDMSKRGPV